MNRIAAAVDRWAEEPFRVFFPLGVLASLAGVLLWPAYFAGWTTVWPAEAHARWMVGGFGGCMVVGFLGTAGPRLLGAEPWCRFEILWHAAMALAVMTALALNRIAPADLLLGFWLFGVLASLAFRVLVGRRDVPPPGFPVALLGVAGAVLGGIALSMDPVIGLAPETRVLWRLVYFQGLLWLPLLGVAPYLLPRFFGRSSAHSFAVSTTLPPGWLRHFAVSLAAGLAVLASFVLESRGLLRSGLLLRAGIVGTAMLVTVPGLPGLARTNGLGWALRVVPLAGVGGWLLAAGFASSPLLRVGMLHLMFISASGLVMLAVACRVVLGHGGRHDRLESPLRWCHGLWGMVLFTAATRVFADLVEKIRVSHYIYAAAMWVVVVLFWAWKLRKEARAPRWAPDAPHSRCPKPSRRRRLSSLPAEASR